MDSKDLSQQVEDDIKKQIAEHYSLPESSVTRSQDSQGFRITVSNKRYNEANNTSKISNNKEPKNDNKADTSNISKIKKPNTDSTNNIINTNNETFKFFCWSGSRWIWKTCTKGIGMCPRSVANLNAACRQFKQTEPAKLRNSTSSARHS